MLTHAKFLVDYSSTGNSISGQYPYGKFIDDTRDYFNRVLESNNWLEIDENHSQIQDSTILWYRAKPTLKSYVPVTASGNYLLDKTSWNRTDFWTVARSGIGYVWEHNPALFSPYSFDAKGNLWSSAPSGDAETLARQGRLTKSYYSRFVASPSNTISLSQTPALGLPTIFATRYISSGIFDTGLALSGTIDQKLEQINDNYQVQLDWVQNNGQGFVNNLKSALSSKSYFHRQPPFDTIDTIYGSINFPYTVYKESIWDFQTGSTPYFSCLLRQGFVVGLIPLSRQCFGFDGDEEYFDKIYSPYHLFGNDNIKIVMNTDEPSGSEALDFTSVRALNRFFGQPGIIETYGVAQMYFRNNPGSNKISISVGFINTDSWKINNDGSNGIGAATNYWTLLGNTIPSVNTTNRDEIANLVADDIEAGNNTVVGEIDPNNTYDLNVFGTEINSIEEDGYITSAMEDENIGYRGIELLVDHHQSQHRFNIPSNLLTDLPTKNTMYIAVHVSNPNIEDVNVFANGIENYTTSFSPTNTNNYVTLSYKDVTAINTGRNRNLFEPRGRFIYQTGEALGSYGEIGIVWPTGLQTLR